MTRPQWEYRTCGFGDLETLGRDGWELCCPRVGTTSYILKRPIDATLTVGQRVVLVRSFRSYHGILPGRMGRIETVFTHANERDDTHYWVFFPSPDGVGGDAAGFSRPELEPIDEEEGA